jgi:hypothetical protein
MHEAQHSVQATRLRRLTAQTTEAEAVSNPEVCAGSLTPAQKTVTKSVDDYENQNYR